MGVRRQGQSLGAGRWGPVSDAPSDLNKIRQHRAGSRLFGLPVRIGSGPWSRRHGPRPGWWNADTASLNLAAPRGAYRFKSGSGHYLPRPTGIGGNDRNSQSIPRGWGTPRESHRRGSAHPRSTPSGFHPPRAPFSLPSPSVSLGAPAFPPLRPLLSPSPGFLIPDSGYGRCRAVVAVHRSRPAPPPVVTPGFAVPAVPALPEKRFMIARWRFRPPGRGNPVAGSGPGPGEWRRASRARQDGPGAGSRTPGSAGRM